MTEHADIATVVILSALGIVLLIGLAVVLLIVVHQRRVRHRADMAELQLRHANDMREVEREVLDHTLAEVSTELHDNVGQLLTAVRLDAVALIDGEPVAAIAKGMESTVERAIGELRRISRGLNTDHLRERPLATLLEEECKRVHRPGKQEVVLMADVPNGDPPPDQHVVLFRIFQEAMNNALKHAQASRITVTLVNNGELRMAVQDNGVGYEPATAKGGGQGLANIKRRAALIGATCTMISVPGKGTTIIVSR